MFMRLGIFALAALLVLPSAEVSAVAGSSSERGRVPQGAAIGPSGHATITDAPSAPYTPATPTPPGPITADQLAGHAQFRRAGEFQNAVRDEVAALARKLRAAEKGNFVDLYFDNEGEPSVVFRFLRDGSRTLAKYTRHPRFFATEVRYSTQQLEAAMNFMLEAFREDRVIQGGGIGSNSNRADVEINVTPEEFWALVARKGVKIPEAVKLDFRVAVPAKAINRPLPADIAPLVRIFPRDDRPIHLLPSIESRAKVVLRDGCFRLPDHGDALALFPLGAQLFIDKDGYLAFGTDEVPGYARVGETVVTPGTIPEETAPDLVEPINKACGPGKVLKIHGMRSAAADRAQTILSTNADSLRQLQASYGLSEATSRKVLEACKKKMGFGTCHLSPPPPVRSAADCPAGSALRFGLCRSPEGYIRPIPKWIQELIDG